jgi:hypothetical protein
MEYLVGGHRYSFNYQNRREDFLKYKQMSDAEFVENAFSALHFAMHVCYVKDLGCEATISDKGVCHQLLHLLDGDCRAGVLAKLDEIRASFNTVCELA